jgi:hypothetical protein
MPPAISPMMLTSSEPLGITILALLESDVSMASSFLNSCALPTKYLSAAPVLNLIKVNFIQLLVNQYYTI